MISSTRPDVQMAVGRCLGLAGHALQMAQAVDDNAEFSALYKLLDDMVKHATHLRQSVETAAQALLDLKGKQP